MKPPTHDELVAARERLQPYLDGYPEPMIDARRLRIANGSASTEERREVRAEIAVLKAIAHGKLPAELRHPPLDVDEWPCDYGCGHGHRPGTRCGHNGCECRA